MFDDLCCGVVEVIGYAMADLIRNLQRPFPFPSCQQDLRSGKDTVTKIVAWQRYLENSGWGR